MSSVRLLILAALVASGITALCLVFPTMGGAQAGGVPIYLENWDFETPGPGSYLPGWQGGRRVRAGDSYVAEIRGPAGIVHQTISTAEAKKILDLAKGRVTITFVIVSPLGDSGLVVSFGGRVFDADQFRSPVSPEKVEISLENYRFTNPGDRALSFQVKSTGRRVHVDDVRVMYMPLGPDDGGGVEPTPTPSLLAIVPPGSLGQYPAVSPFATPTPRPAASLDTQSLRVSVNPPIIYVAPAQVGSSLARAAIGIELFNTDGIRMTPQAVADREGKVSFKLVGTDGVVPLFGEDENGHQEQVHGYRDLADYLSGATKDDDRDIEPRQLYFVPDKVEDAEARLLVNIELEDIPRKGVPRDPLARQIENIQKLELSTVVPISIRVSPGTPGKGTRQVRGLAPIARFNRIFLER